MRHEREYVPTEAEMLRIFNESKTIPMPELIHYDDSREICDVPYFFMSYIDGRPLCECTGITDTQRSNIKEQIGKATRQICSLEAKTFGIPGISESYCTKNSEFVLLLFDWLLLDAKEKNIDIPGIHPNELHALIKKYESDLDMATVPKYIHTDTWDGNIMVKDGEFKGLVDFATILYGDPLMSHDFHDFGNKPNSFFLKGYGKNDFTKNEKIRIQIYRIWQRLGMVVERGYREYEDCHMYDWVLEEFKREVEHLQYNLSKL